MNEPIKQRLAPKCLARKQPANADPNGSAASVATRAILSESLIAVHSSGERSSMLNILHGRRSS